MQKEQFIENATGIGLDTNHKRSELVEIFENIDKNIICEHSPSDAYYQAEYILRNQKLEGPIVEFGCYKGGMSCKLSHLAEMLGKKYMMFDSFEGLPFDATYECYDKNLAFLGKFYKNQFSCSLTECQINLQKYGMFFVCEFIAGKIEDTLPNFNIKPSHIFIDVDIIETAKFIIENIYEKKNCKTIFTHEACLIDYVNELTDDGWWKNVIKKPKPIRGTSLQQIPHGLLNAGCLDCYIEPDEDLDFQKIIRETKP